VKALQREVKRLKEDPANARKHVAGLSSVEEESNESEQEEHSVYSSHDEWGLAKKSSSTYRHMSIPKKNRTDSKRKKKQQELKKRKKQDQTENESDGSFYEEGKCIVCTEFELQKTSYIVFCPELKKKKRVSGSNKKKTQQASGNTYKQLKNNR
jgi:hypothetical protein